MFAQVGGGGNPRKRRLRRSPLNRRLPEPPNLSSTPWCAPLGTVSREDLPRHATDRHNPHALDPLVSRAGDAKSGAESEEHPEALDAKYASALNGSTICPHKAHAAGETVYRLRVASLSKSDAKALCSRLKSDGGSCFVASEQCAPSAPAQLCPQRASPPLPVSYFDVSACEFKPLPLPKLRTPTQIRLRGDVND
jgi:hypothetical protein